MRIKALSKKKEAAKSAPKQKPKKKTAAQKLGGGLVRLLLVVLETVLLVALALYGAMTVLAKGPSEAARDRFVMTMQETSALKFVPRLVLSQAEIDDILKSREQTVDYQEMDTSLVTINTPQQDDAQSGPTADAWGLVDDDGDGIVLDRVRGEGYNGYMMVVYDPTRIIMGSVTSDFERQGRTVAEMVQYFDGVAGINAGGFLDPGGMGNGATPDSMVVYDGKVYYAQFGLSQYGCFVGFDNEYKMHVGKYSREDVEANNIRYGVCFGPALVINGEPVDPNGFASGQNPRTAIGQRSDGAVLMLVIDGRQATSLGASLRDVADIMLSYGAVNACNLDGGSSSLLWYNGEYVNNKAHIVGIRNIPTSFIVLKEGVRTDG